MILPAEGKKVETPMVFQKLGETCAVVEGKPAEAAAKGSTVKE